jgi:hypothetical protein
MEPISAIILLLALLIILFHQFTYIVAEEKLLDKVGLLEGGAEDDIEGGEAAGQVLIRALFTLRISPGAAGLT